MSHQEERPEGTNGEHPETDRAYDREAGGEVPADQPYEGPDPTEGEQGDGDDEDQGV